MTDCDKDKNQQYIAKTNKGKQEYTTTGLGWNIKNNKQGRGGGGTTKSLSEGPGCTGGTVILGPRGMGLGRGVRTDLGGVVWVEGETVRG